MCSARLIISFVLAAVFVVDVSARIRRDTILTPRLADSTRVNFAESLDHDSVDAGGYSATGKRLLHRRKILQDGTDASGGSNAITIPSCDSAMMHDDYPGAQMIIGNPDVSNCRRLT